MELSSSNNLYLTFSREEREIIKNGLRLGNVIKHNFNIPDKPQIIWLGEHTQSGSPVDLSINGIGFSLKEESFILENMGLYKLLNILIGENRFDRGLHIFESFSPDEFNKWFETTRDFLIFLGPNPFNYTGRNYRSFGEIRGNNLTLEYSESNKLKERITIPNFSSCSYDTYQKKTTSKLREKVFSKCIKEKVEDRSEYNKSKRDCSISAGKELVNFVNTKRQGGINHEMLLRFFRLGTSPYYYAKSNSAVIEIYKVPGIKEIANKLVLDKFYYDVPQSQLNIMTIIKNNDTGESIGFRNELRYSHGQFNGTPEAKFYHASGDLSSVYAVVYKEN